MRILARDIDSGDGVANACIAEAADRLEEYAQPSLSEEAGTLADRGLPMSAIRVGMKLQSTTSTTMPVITVTEITDNGFRYTHLRHVWGDALAGAKAGSALGWKAIPITKKLKERWHD